MKPHHQHLSHTPHKQTDRNNASSAVFTQMFIDSLTHWICGPTSLRSKQGCSSGTMARLVVQETSAGSSEACTGRYIVAPLQCYPLPGYYYYYYPGSWTATPENP
eukprot:3120112-Rhodomonas_salina.2